MAVEGTAIWDYISRLLDILALSSTDELYRAVILQEISNVCHLEYNRSQGNFKRHVQTGTGAKWFSGLPNLYDKAGNMRIAIKGGPEKLTRTDPQLHYILRLCQPETHASEAVTWITKLFGLYESHPSERETLSEREAESLCDLVVIVSFIQDLTPAVKMPPLSRKKGLLFVSRHQELNIELNELKKRIDLRECLVPIDNLLEPGVQEAALNAVDEFMIKNSGTNIHYLYQNSIDNCMEDLRAQYQQIKSRIDQKDERQWLSQPATAPPSQTVIEQRRQKDKTRPPHSSIYDVAVPSAACVSEAPAPAIPRFEVSPSTVEVFSSFFDKTRSRGSIPWVSFEAAMAEVGFSISPRTGSIFTFTPPDSMVPNRQLSIHRPHKSQIEGHRILLLAQRLHRVYGWDVDTFQTANKYTESSQDSGGEAK